MTFYPTALVPPLDPGTFGEGESLGRFASRAGRLTGRVPYLLAATAGLWVAEQIYISTQSPPLVSGLIPVMNCSLGAPTGWTGFNWPSFSGTCLTGQAGPGQPFNTVFPATAAFDRTAHSITWQGYLAGVVPRWKTLAIYKLPAGVAPQSTSYRTTVWRYMPGASGRRAGGIGWAVPFIPPKEDYKPNALPFASVGGYGAATDRPAWPDWWTSTRIDVPVWVGPRPPQSPSKGDDTPDVPLPGGKTLDWGFDLPAIRVTKAAHVRTKTEPNTQEDKVKMNSAVLKALKAYYGYTEVLDLIDAVYKGLPKSSQVNRKLPYGMSYQERKVSYPEKVHAIVQAILDGDVQSIDVVNIAIQIALNQLSDEAYARLFGLQQRLATDLGIPLSPGGVSSVLRKGKK